MTKEIELTQGQYALVDDEDFDYLNQWKWFAAYDPSPKSYYAVYTQYGKERKINIRMHRVITNCPDGYEVDHINGNTLDNRRCNLRICIKRDNQKNKKIYKNNTSGYKGVSWSKANKKWIASIKINGCQKYLGLYSTPEKAHEAYKAAALKYHGEFANFGE